MSKREIVETLTFADRPLQIEIHTAGDGLYTYTALKWVESGPDYPHEPQPGYWSPQSRGGLYSTAAEAKRGAIDDYGLKAEIES